ncbi:aldo/keto reductase [Lentzea sp. NPDC004782]|uniref:aldo/keto reductase n=1 Tax=Lentzea sp. NPDC004782 TaxID=3154458 RepID=UPI0033B65277
MTDGGRTWTWALRQSDANTVAKGRRDRGAKPGDLVAARMPDSWEFLTLQRRSSAPSMIAEARGVSRAQVALAWVAQQRGITAPILGATGLRHLTEAVAAPDPELSPAEHTRLTEHHTPRLASGINRSRAGATLPAPS